MDKTYIDSDGFEYYEIIGGDDELHRLPEKKD